MYPEDEGEREKPRVIVLDSAALIAGTQSLLALGGIVDPSTETSVTPLSQDERVTFYTTPDVVKEVRDTRARAKLSLLDGFLIIRPPSSEALSVVTKFARATGDYSVLSLTDLRVIALCWMLEVERGGISRLREQPVKVSSGQIRIGSLIPFGVVERAEQEKKLADDLREAESGGWVTVGNPKITTEHSTLPSSQQRRPKSSKQGGLSQNETQTSSKSQQVKEGDCIPTGNPKLTADSPMSPSSRRRHRPKNSKQRGLSQNETQNSNKPQQVEADDCTPTGNSKLTTDSFTSPSSQRRRRPKSSKQRGLPQSEMLSNNMPQQAEESDFVTSGSSENTRSGSDLPSTRRRRRPKSSKRSDLSQSKEGPDTQVKKLETTCHSLPINTKGNVIAGEESTSLVTSNDVLPKNAGDSSPDSTANADEASTSSLTLPSIQAKSCSPVNATQTLDPRSVLCESTGPGIGNANSEQESVMVMNDVGVTFSFEMSDDEDDGVGWINQENLDKNLTQDSLEASQTVEDEKRVGCVTTDFAMQNTMLQMGLKILTVDGRRAIRSIRHFALRCHACGSVTRDLEKKFCDHCGNFAMHRVGFRVDKDGVARAYLNPKKGPFLRGTKYSIPMPRGGRHNKDLILRADQIDTVQQRRIEKRLERMNVDVLDPGTMYNAGANFRPHERPLVIGYGRRNPNEVRRKSRKKR